VHSVDQRPTLRHLCEPLGGTEGPITLVTHGPLNETATHFLGDLGCKIAVVSNKDREVVCLFQRLCAAI